MTPALIFKAEAIVGPADVVAYLGQGEHAGRVSELAYHNSIMVQIWSALAARDGRLLATALSRFRLPYITVTPTFSICPKHGYLNGEHEFCPLCDEEIAARRRQPAEHGSIV